MYEIYIVFEMYDFGFERKPYSANGFSTLEKAEAYAKAHLEEIEKTCGDSSFHMRIEKHIFEYNWEEGETRKIQIIKNFW